MCSHYESKTSENRTFTHTRSEATAGFMSRHPMGLTVLYLTEVWERFSFYGLKALLVLYLNSGVLAPERFQAVWGSSLVVRIFGFHDGDAASVQALSSAINEVYAGCCYLTPLAGGMDSSQSMSAIRD